MNHEVNFKDKNSEIIKELQSLETSGQRQTKSAKRELRINIDKLNDSTFKKMILYYDSVLLSPVEYTITVLLTALSGVIGKRAYFEFSHIRKYLNVWSVIIGKSSTMKKSTCLNKVLEYVEDINKLLIDDYELRKARSKDDDIKPQREYLVYPHDVTPERFTEILCGQDKGIFVYNELGQWLKQFNKGYSGDFKQFLTGIYDIPKQYEVDRKTREGVFIERPYVSVVGASTIEWLKAGLESADVSSGFLARFLFSIRNVNDKDFISLFDLTNRDSDINEFYYNAKEVFNRLHNDIIKDTVLTFSKDAESIMRKYEKTIHNRQSNINTNNDEASYLDRLKDYCFKISGIIALTNGRTTITTEDIEDAILLCDYYEKNIRLLLDDELRNTKFSKKENDIWEYINKQKNRTCQRSKIMKKFRFSKRDADLYLDSMVDKEMINLIEKDNPNNFKKTVYYIALDHEETEYKEI